MNRAARGRRTSGATLVVALVLGASVVVTAVPAPGSTLGAVLYLAVVTASAIVLSVAVGRMGRAWRRPWVWLAAAQWGWVVAEAIALDLQLTGRTVWPSVADPVYLLSYVPATIGLVGLTRAHDPGRRRGTVLEATVFTVSAAALFFVFVVLPLATDGGQPLLSRTIGAAYPMADVVLFFVLARALTGAGARPPALMIATIGVAATVTADLAWTFAQSVVGVSESPRWMTALWLTYYIAITIAATTAEDPATRPARAAGEGRFAGSKLLAITAAAVLPSLVLTLGAAALDPTQIRWLALGSVAVIAAVMGRMSDLLADLRLHSRRLAELARTDALTGLPNRRTWDHHVDRVLLAADLDGRPVHLALIDVDHFKIYNDTRGHQSGDELLRDAATAWAEGLERGNNGGFLARWGGEEFAVLLHGVDDARAQVLVEQLRALTPEAQTVSAGLARRVAGEDGAALLRRADAALYLANANGRDRCVLAEPGAPTASLAR